MKTRHANAIGAALFMLALPTMAQSPGCILGVLAPSVTPELVQGGFTFVEEPVGTADSGLSFSNIRVNKTHFFYSGAKISVVRENSNGANGMLEKLWEDMDEPNPTRVPFAKFVPPTIAGGFVIRGAYSNEVHIYDLKKRSATANRLDFPILPAEERQTQAVLISQTIGQGGEDVLRAARELSARSAQLAGAGRSAEAVMTQQAMVDVLVGFTPATGDRLDFLILLAEGRQTLMVRLIADARVEQAAALTDQTIADFRNYAGQSGADVLHAARDLFDLSAKLADKGRTAEAVMTQQAMVDVLTGSPLAGSRP
jgi:hypothetical protein